MGSFYGRFNEAIERSIGSLKAHGKMVDPGRWQGVPTAGKPDLKTKEILDLTFQVPCERSSWYNDSLDEYIQQLASEIQPNQAWADEHFAERVGGVPLNPDPSHERWPWWRGQDDTTKQEGKFTHTYSERFWPSVVTGGEGTSHYREGIRFRYGDYNDVLDLLAEDSYTRQAYLPIFFPEDTGAVHRGRIPCSLGYHFLLRGNHLHMWYEIRSCDAVRHFRDDLYLAARLLVHTLVQLSERDLNQEKADVWPHVDPGRLYFSAHSFHVHMGDYHRL